MPGASWVTDTTTCLLLLPPLHTIPCLPSPCQEEPGTEPSAVLHCPASSLPSCMPARLDVLLPCLQSLLSLSSLLPTMPTHSLPVLMVPFMPCLHSHSDTFYLLPGSPDLVISGCWSIALLAQGCGFVWDRTDGWRGETGTGGQCGAFGPTLWTLFPPPTGMIHLSFLHAWEIGRGNLGGSLGGLDFFLSSLLLVSNLSF